MSWRRTAVLAVFLIRSLAAASLASESIPRWFATWAAAPSPIEPKATEDQGLTLQHQTVRQIVHTSIRGSAVRLRLSNLFGTEPLAISNVHFARSTAGNHVDPSTDRLVTFAGSATVGIAAGGSVLSDPVICDVPAAADVAVSMYFPSAKPVRALTGHSYTSQISYFADGDQSKASSPVGSSKISNYYFLTGIDVRNSDAAGALVAFGASITDGFGTTINRNERWTNFLSQRFVRSGLNIAVVSAGISGNKLLADNGAFGVSAFARFDRDVLGAAGVRWVIFSDNPINDLSGDRSIAPKQITDALSSLITRAHQHHLKFFCSTLTPFEGAERWTKEAEATREQVNRYIRSNQSGCDGVVDQDKATHDPEQPTRYLPAFDSGDHLHPNAAGNKAIADAVDLALFANARSRAVVVQPGKP